jgi:predicted nucleic-acid-binding Zn-ribbon protein
MKKFLVITCQREDCGEEQVTRLSEEFGALWPVTDLDEDNCPKCGGSELIETIESEGA